MPESEHDEHTTLKFCRSTDDGSIAPPAKDDREEQLRASFAVGSVVADRYTLIRQLGDGSMGRVFLAKDLRLDRWVAMKVVLHERSVRHLEAMLQREARLGASLNHKGIAAVYDFGVHENKSFTVFEFIEGETLRALLRRRGRLPLDEVLQILGDLAAALDCAHAHGVVHRDLKPENICFTKGGDFKILDFGLALDAKTEVDARVFRHAGLLVARTSPMPADGRQIRSVRLGLDRVRDACRKAAVHRRNDPRVAADAHAHGAAEIVRAPAGVAAGSRRRDRPRVA